MKTHYIFKIIYFLFHIKKEGYLLHKNRFKGLLHSDESQSLHSQLYLQEEESLFI